MNNIGEWQVFIAFTTIAAFIILIFRASRFFAKLEGSTDNLNDAIKALKNEVQLLGQNNYEGHRRLWHHNDEQDNILADHETRITVIEKGRLNNEKGNTESNS